MIKDTSHNEGTVKLVVYVPETHADVVRRAMGEAGTGTCRRLQTLHVFGAHPYIGTPGKLEKVIEERIETVCYKKDLEKVIKAIKEVHPYEEIALDVYPLILNPHKTTYK